MAKLSKSPHTWRIDSPGESSLDKLFNLEYDLRSTKWILKKVRTNEVYAQNLYAALCNNSFKKVLVDDTSEVLIKILSEEIKHWTCSWRYAGGIVSDMCEKGDYMDWYCSGITDLDDKDTTKHVPEGFITIEIRDDLRTLGWIVIDE